jgi:pyruvate/2-oxoglutarate dehydrogenase complex dihydrolipoamide dehydrogenase (E3) component
MVTGLIDMHLDYYKGSGADLILGSGRFVAPKTMEVTLADGGTRLLHGKKVIVNTGSRATIDPVPGLIEAGPLTHIEALELDHIPDHRRLGRLCWAGVGTTAQGHVKVNEKLETTAPDVWAIGDCAGSPAFYAHLFRRFPHHCRKPG